MQRIEDRIEYDIIGKIADGGMGSVYEAVQFGVEGFQKNVAIKTLLARYAQSQRLNTMFIQEAKLVADLVHENIVQILQLGKNGEDFYIVMELVRGVSLHELIRQHADMKIRLPVELAVFIASRVARGLAYAHSRRDAHGRPLDIVHRDVNPKNVLISTEGLPKLADFGLAIITAHLDKGKKLPLVGKLPYLSPEQAHQQPVDFRADIFGLGALLFEMLAGKEIRLAGNIDDDLKLAQDGYVDWDRLPNSTPPDIFQILLTCLAADPQNRFASTAKLAHELEYSIYRHGYGPTIQSLEEYLRKYFPGLYR